MIETGKKWCRACKIATYNGWSNEKGGLCCSKCWAPRPAYKIYSWCAYCKSNTEDEDGEFTRWCAECHRGKSRAPSTTYMVREYDKDKEPIIVSGPVAPREAKG